jgi:hypothetical protein
MVIDFTDLTVDVNWFRRGVTKADLEERNCNWGYMPQGLLCLVQAHVGDRAPPIKAARVLAPSRLA